MQKIKKGLKSVWVVNVKDGENHEASIEFPTEASALIYEKLIEIQEDINGLYEEEETEEEPLNEQEKELLERLQKRAKK